LQNFGELLVAKISPKVAQRCEQYDTSQLPWQLQTLTLGYNYTDISADLLKIWQIPEKIILPIRHFNAASSIEINKDVKILNLASRLALIDSHSDQFTYEGVIDESFCKALGLSVEHLTQAAEFAKKDATSILSMMNPKLFSRVC